MRTYSELILLPTFEERYEYLRLRGIVGQETFGYDRILNQRLYTSQRWRSVREKVIIRDGARDLAIEDREIFDRIVIHHMNPITKTDVDMNRDHIYELEFLICTSHRTHQAIHYSDASLLILPTIERKPNDTKLW